ARNRPVREEYGYRAWGLPPYRFLSGRGALCAPGSGRSARASAAGSAVKGIHHVRASSPALDCNDVETGRATEPSGASEECECKARQTQLLARIDRFEAARRAPRLDLDEYDHVSVERDEIELTERRPYVAAEDRESLAAKKLRCRVLAVSSEDLPAVVAGRAALPCASHRPSVLATGAVINGVHGMIVIRRAVGRDALLAILPDGASVQARLHSTRRRWIPRHSPGNVPQQRCCHVPRT